MCLSCERRGAHSLNMDPGWCELRSSMRQSWNMWLDEVELLEDPLSTLSGAPPVHKPGRFGAEKLNCCVFFFDFGVPLADFLC